MNTTLDTLSTLVASYLRTSAPRARIRTLDDAEIYGALRAHFEAVEANPGATIRTRLVGGFLPNRYRQAGECDRVEVETDARGFTTYHVSRAYAEKRPWGEGDVLRTWIVSAGGAMKRLAA